MHYSIEETTSEEQFIQVATTSLTGRILNAIAHRNECIIGLSGGSTPKPVYEALAQEEEIDWSLVKIFLVDDRHVPADHDDSNQKLVYETLIDRVDVPESNIFFPHTELPIDDCVIGYQDQLTKLFSQHPADVITLGMGEDGHIASLFPPVAEDAFSEVLALHTTTDEFAVYDRISVSPLVIMAAQAQLLLLKGEEKKKVFEQCINSDMDPVRWPLQVALATGGTTVVMQS